MKRKNLYVIYNVLEEESSPPMVASSDEHAMKIFNASMKNLPDMSNPSEFSLYKIGSFNKDFPWDIESTAPMALVTGTITAEIGGKNE